MRSSPRTAAASRALTLGGAGRGLPARRPASAPPATPPTRGRRSDTRTHAARAGGQADVPVFLNTFPLEAEKRLWFCDDVAASVAAAVADGMTRMRVVRRRMGREGGGKGVESGKAGRARAQARPTSPPPPSPVGHHPRDQPRARHVSHRHRARPRARGGGIARVRVSRRRPAAARRRLLRRHAPLPLRRRQDAGRHGLGGGGGAGVDGHARRGRGRGRGRKGGRRPPRDRAHLPHAHTHTLIHSRASGATS